jgi:hypothetical protein
MLVLTMQELSYWGQSMASLLMCCVGAALGLVPYAMHRGEALAGLIVLLLVPLAVTYTPAVVSSACDDLLEQLNEISFLADMYHKERCGYLRKSYLSANRGQGLGFQMFGVVIDKPMLKKIAVSLASVGGTVLTTLYALVDHGLLNETYVNGTNL